MYCKELVPDKSGLTAQECGETTLPGRKYCEKHLKNKKETTMSQPITVEELAELLNIPEVELRKRLRFVSLEDITTEIKRVLTFTKKYEIVKGDETVDEILNKL